MRIEIWTLATMVLVGCGDDVGVVRDAAPGQPDGAAGAIDATLIDAVVPDAAPPDAPLPVVTAASLVAGFGHTCLLHPTGRVKCWGDNSHGQLGLGDSAARGDGADELGAALPRVQLGADRYAVALAAGGSHTCAILDDGAIKCWGGNGDGQLGLGDTAARGDGAGEMGDALPPIDLGPGRTAIALAAGGSHTCALLDDHAVKCWGSATSGQLGLGDTVTRGDAPGEMGDALAAVDFGPLDVVALSAGSYFTCATSSAGIAACWGGNSEGQLGIGSSATRGDGPGEMGGAISTAGFGPGRHVATLAVGEFHSCAILDDASLKCFGAGQGGQLGLEDTSNRGDQPGEMGDALPVVNLGSGRTARGLAFTQSDTCALRDDDSVACWGYNFYGQAGQGTTTHIGDGVGEMGDALGAVPLPAGRAIAEVVGGGEHMCVRFEDGGVRCWGFGGYGQLGQNDTVTRGDQPGEIDATPDIDLGW